VSTYDNLRIIVEICFLLRSYVYKLEKNPGRVIVLCLTVAGSK